MADSASRTVAAPHAPRNDAAPIPIRYGVAPASAVRLALTLIENAYAYLAGVKKALAALGGPS